MESFNVSASALVTLSVLAMGLVAFLILQRVRTRLLVAGRAQEAQARQELARQLEGRQDVEDTLRRTLAMFQLLQDVTAAAGTAHSLEEAIQSSLDIICSYTGWPVAHAFYPVFPKNLTPHLKATGIWHLESPHDYESFLRVGEQKALAMGKALPGKAWSGRRVVWSRYIEDPHSTDFFRRAVEVGLIMGFAIPVFKGADLVCVLEFFSPPIPDPDSTMLDALTGVGEQLGSMAKRLQAEAELAQLNQRLIELNDEKNQFLGIASHDLKNPLNNLCLMGELLVSGGLAHEEVAVMGRRITEEAKRTSQLIQKLLDVNAIESGNFNLHFARVSLGEALLLVQANYKDRSEAKGQALVLALGGRDVEVWADREYLQEVVDNLVSNALKFMAPGPPRRTVTLRLVQEAASGIVEVQDEGPGFSEEDQSRAFGRFSRLSARPTGGEESTGLGLSIVRRLVEAMGGRVELKSQRGKGACFRLVFPLVPENLDTAAPTVDARDSEWGSLPPRMP